MNEREILSLKEKADKAKEKEQKLRWREGAILNQFKTDFDCKSKDEVKNKLQQLEKKRKKVKKQIESQTKEISKKYNLDGNS